MALQLSSIWSTRLWTLGDYEGVLRDCIVSVKTKGHKALAKELVEATVNLVKTELAGQLTIDAVFSVPASQQGQRFRGFSLPANLESRLTEELGWESLPVALRREYRSSTKTSQGLTAGQRLARADSLVSDADSVRADRGTLLLIDDVVTTGSTLGRCIKQARGQGFSEILCLALAEQAQEI